MSDEIEHPSHYCDGRKVEPISAILDWQLDFCLGNTVKYISRAGRKPGNDVLTDLRKARWYLDKEIQFLEEGFPVDDVEAVVVHLREEE